MRLGILSWLALLGIVLGWFAMNSFVTHLGAASHSFRFSELGPVLLRPARLLTGLGRIDAGKHYFLGAIALLALLLALLPLTSKSKLAHLGSFAPLLLMLASFTVLYIKTSGNVFSVGDGANVFRVQVLNFANSVAGRVGSVASRRISLGVGVYFAALSCLVLAVDGVLRLRGHGKSETI